MNVSTEAAIPNRRSTSSRGLTHIPELDGIRGLAALMVFFHHVCFASIQPSGWSAPIRALHDVSMSGMYGVDLFFVLSGFLITSLLIQARHSQTYYHDFYWKRALRILPLYILCILGVFLFVPGSLVYVLLSALFLANFSWVFHIISLGPFWTLAIEEQFYLVWPTVVRRRSVPQLRRWAIAIGLTAVVLRFIAAAFGHYDYAFTFFRCDGLAFGAFLACWFSHRDPAVPCSRRESRAILFCFVLGVLLVTLSVARQILSMAFLAAFRQSGVTLLCGSVIAFLIAHTDQRKVAFLRSRTLTFFGLISYAMYMIHGFIMGAYDHFRGRLIPGDNIAYAIRFFTILAITLLLCVLIRYCIELPALRLRKYVLAKPSPARSQQSADPL